MSNPVGATREIDSLCNNFSFQEFILQIEGKKKWTLFKPIQKLAFLDSEDLSQDNIGKATHEFVLEVL